MPRDVNGNVTPPPGTVVNTGDTILPSQHNPVVIEYADLLAQSLSRDGQGGMRAPLQMNGFRVTNMGDGTLPNDGATVSQAQGIMPVGSVIDYAGNAAPTNWLLAFGQSLTTAAYPELFAVIGYTYGGSAANFNLPDLRGRVIAGLDGMGGSSADRLSGVMASTSRGASGGAKDHVLTIAQMPPHNHGVNDPGHVHQWGAVQEPGGVNYQGLGSNPYFGGLRSTGGATTGISIQNSGSGAAHTNVQPTMVMNKIIKVR